MPPPHTFLTVVILLIVTVGISQTATAQETPKLPYIIYGTVEDGDGTNISGATVTIERLETGETNLENADGTPKTLTSTHPRVDLITNSDGNFLYELSAMTDFQDEDQFKITAQKGDMSGSETVEIDTDTPPGVEVIVQLHPAFAIEMCLLVVGIGILMAVFGTVIIRNKGR